MADTPFSNLFGQSPVRPIQDHIKLAHQCAELLDDFFEASVDNNWETASQVYDRITELEHAADDAKNNLRSNLPNSLMMPVDRGDLLLLVTKQDEIANFTKDIAGIMLGRKMRFPDSLIDQVRSFIKTTIDTSAQAVTAVNEMDELLELGFKGRILDVVHNLIDQLNRLEHENDEQQIQIRAALFEIEEQLPPVEVMFLYKIIEWIGELADSAQSAGGKLQLLIAR
ncbi:TIGR00153 family protein [Arenicella sp. 4NH20-0111]|uniref:TIGR00153 family protein n=1 Tax=Arenicella sp. 4NH20-0111 TaxID=3127648 RepID=UPI00310A4CE2